jgi:NitT/TauT family transport system permease protein
LSSARRAGGRISLSLAGIAVVVAVWWLISATGLVSSSKLPSPATVWTALWDRVQDGTIPVGIGTSLLRLAFGMAVAVILGTLVGVWMASSPLFQRSVGGLVVGLQALPPIAWLPLAILWFGITERAVVFVVILGAFPSIAMATAASVRHVPPNLIRAGRTLGADGWALYREVVVPAALPGYIEGLRQGWVFAWRSLMAAELIVAGGRGLGHALDNAGRAFDAPTILALMVVIAGIGILIDTGFAAMDRRVRARRGLLVS